MSFLYVFNGVFGLVQTTLNYCNGFITGCSLVYRIFTQKPVWYILNNGQFANASEINVLSKEDFWTYDGVILCQNPALNAKKLPYLTLEFNYDDTTVNMDDFIENFKYRGSNAPPLSVVMGAFTIHSACIHPWTRAKFRAFTKMGDSIEFMEVFPSE
jgi:hypothetical protein